MPFATANCQGISRLNSDRAIAKSHRTRNATVRALFATSLLFVFLCAAAAAHAATETVLYSFPSYSGDGENPAEPLIMDAGGNFYSTTYDGGAYSYGTVFKLTSSGTESLLYSFCAQPNCTDGANPSSGVITDSEGNFYGTTHQGGSSGYWGTVFKLTPAGEETVLHNFENSTTDGGWPSGGLIIDKQGNLYGTTILGGANDGGTVFKITPSGEETVLYSFGDAASGDGYAPSSGVIMDSAGNFYGTCYSGGANGNGTVFKLTPAGEETILYNFGTAASKDGQNPTAGLIMDKEGNLYGTTPQGGTHKDGTAFKLTPEGVETILHDFGAGANDGVGPNGLIMDKEDNLYGTTTLGKGTCYGTVFKLTPTGKKTILHHFYPNTGDGYDPEATLLMDSKGHLYGTTNAGGQSPYQYGTVFEVNPE